MNEMPDSLPWEGGFKKKEREANMIMIYFSSCSYAFMISISSNMSFISLSACHVLCGAKTC